MPDWVIVAERSDGVPVVLCEWVMEHVWVPIATAKSIGTPPRRFRDRWRAKRQAWRFPRELAARAIRADRL